VLFECVYYDEDGQLVMGMFVDYVLFVLREGGEDVKLFVGGYLLLLLMKLWLAVLMLLVDLRKVFGFFGI